MQLSTASNEAELCPSDSVRGKSVPGTHLYTRHLRNKRIARHIAWVPYQMVHQTYSMNTASSQSLHAYIYLYASITSDGHLDEAAAYVDIDRYIIPTIPVAMGNTNTY